MKFFMWLGIGVVTVPLQGFVIQTLWRWFIVPLGVIALTLPQAIGFSILVKMLTARLDFREKTKDEEEKEILGAFLIPLWWWGIGSIAQMFL